jgi:hypothetical protein
MEPRESHLSAEIRWEIINEVRRQINAELDGIRQEISDQIQNEVPQSIKIEALTHPLPVRQTRPRGTGWSEEAAVSTESSETTVTDSDSPTQQRLASKKRQTPEPATALARQLDRGAGVTSVVRWTEGPVSQSSEWAGPASSVRAVGPPRKIEALAHPLPVRKTRPRGTGWSKEVAVSTESSERTVTDSCSPTQQCLASKKRQTPEPAAALARQLDRGAGATSALRSTEGSAFQPSEGAGPDSSVGAGQQLRRSGDSTHRQPNSLNKPKSVELMIEADDPYEFALTLEYNRYRTNLRRLINAMKPDSSPPSKRQLRDWKQ